MNKNEQKSIKYTIKEMDFKNFLIAIIPIFIVLCFFGDFFIKNCATLFFICYMGFIIRIFYTPLSNVINNFMFFDVNINIGLKSFPYYFYFLIYVFSLTFAISILFYEEGTKFVLYSYPALSILCACRFIHYRNPNMFKSFVDIIHGIIVGTMPFLLLKLASLSLKSLFPLRDLSFIEMPFIVNPVITSEDFIVICLLAISLWGIMTSSERLAHFVKTH